MNLSVVSPGIFGRIFPRTSQWYNKLTTLMQFVLRGINILTNKGSRIFCKMAKLVAVPKALNIKQRPEKKSIIQQVVYVHFNFEYQSCIKLIHKFHFEGKSKNCHSKLLQGEIGKTSQMLCNFQCGNIHYTLRYFSL